LSIEEFGYKDQLHRALTTKDLVIYGLIFMVPIAPYAVYGFVYKDAKGMVPLAYLLGLVGMLFTALSYATMSRAFPLAGSVYTYAQRRFLFRLADSARLHSGAIASVLVERRGPAAGASRRAPLGLARAIHLLQRRRELHRH